jgi:hypothetical protein
MTDFNILSKIEFLEREDKFLEEFASVTTNPTCSYAKFVLTDDIPNLNKKRIDISEFDNLIKTGIYMPIKMTPGEITVHSSATPLGVISHLKKTNNQVIGLAALWNEERPDDIKMIKESYKKGVPLELSWEILYTDSSVDETTKVEDLKNCVLRGITFVAKPAYDGRTPIIALSQREDSAVWTTKFMNDLPDSSFLYIEDGGTKDTDGNTEPRSLRHFPYKDASSKIDLPHLRNAIAQIPKASISDSLKSSLQDEARKLLQKEGASEESTLEEKEIMTLEDVQAENESLKTQLTQKDSEIETLKTENKTLGEFKASIEESQKQTERLVSIKQKFSEANISKEDKYFEDNKDNLLQLSDSQLDFMIQEMVAFSSLKTETSEKKEKTPKVPPVTGDTSPVSLKDLIKELKEKDL